MDKQVERLVEKTWTKFRDFDASRRLLIAVAGIPGSGKTTLAASVVAGLNKIHHDAYRRNESDLNEERSNLEQPDVAVVIPLDGFHLTRKQLSEMPNAEEAIFRRGAAFTFDPQSYFRLVQKLKAPLEAGTNTIYAPSFDHAIKDPVENDIAIPPTARIIVFEGLYVALDREGWRDAAALMDEIWFVDTSFPLAEIRVAKRNFAAGLSPTFEECLNRTRTSDMRNGREVVAERLPVQEIIESVEDDVWKNELLAQATRSLDGKAGEQPI